MLKKLNNLKHGNYNIFKIKNKSGKYRINTKIQFIGLFTYVNDRWY